MVIFRWLATLLLLASALCFAFYVGTGQAHYKRWGMLVLKWTVVAGLAFFAVIILERMLY